MTDGALAEYMTSVCRRYFEKYPCEFLLNLSGNVSEIDIDKWTGFIGFDLYDRKTFEDFVTNIDKNINSNCSPNKANWDKVKLKIEDKLEEK